MPNIKELLPKIIENQSLAQYTTFKIGGPAKYFFIAQNSDDVIKAAQAAQETNIPFFILGGGSNLLVSDEGFDGLMIRMQNAELIIKNETIEAGAGVLLSKLVIEAANSNLSGLEWATGIPGTIGGAIRGNAGAYGHSISESVQEVKVLDQKLPASSAGKQVANYKLQDCKFGYRDSIFKQNKNSVILEVVLKLANGNQEESRQQMRNLITTRQGKLPHEPCAGSIFKNYELGTMNLSADRQDYEDLKMKLPMADDDHIKKWLQFKKIPTAWFIEQCDLKGKQIGQAQISPKHANTIVNLGGAKAKDVLALMDLIKKQVRDRFDIRLEEEIELIGFN